MTSWQNVELWSTWIEVFPGGGIVVEAMMDCADSFQAAVFNIVHGFYKEAISGLRNGLETMTLASYCKLSGDDKKWEAWQAGEEVKYKQLCDKLPTLPPFQHLEIQARQAATTSLFAGNDGGGRNAWARSLYKRLSRFSHAHSNSSNCHLWQSNGPIYSAEGMKVSYDFFLETHAICLLLAKASEPKLNLTPATRLVMKPNSTRQYLASPFGKVCGFYVKMLFWGGS